MEVIYNWPGLGLFTVHSQRNVDYPAIMGITLYGSVMYVLINLAVDLLQAWIDPRIFLNYTTAVPAISLEPEIQSRRTARHVFNVILRDPLSLISTIVIFLFILIAIFCYQSSTLPLKGAGKTNVPNTLLPPSLEHPFGCDKLGRGHISRVIVKGHARRLLFPLAWWRSLC